MVEALGVMKQGEIGKYPSSPILTERVTMGFQEAKILKEAQRILHDRAWQLADEFPMGTIAVMDNAVVLNNGPFSGEPVVLCSMYKNGRGYHIMDHTGGPDLYVH